MRSGSTDGKIGIQPGGITLPKGAREAEAAPKAALDLPPSSEWSSPPFGPTSAQFQGLVSAPQKHMYAIVTIGARWGPRQCEL